MLSQPGNYNKSRNFSYPNDPFDGTQLMKTWKHFYFVLSKSTSSLPWQWLPPFLLAFQSLNKSLDVCLSIVWLYDDPISHQGSFCVCILFAGFNLISRPKLLSYFLDQRKVQITDSQWFFLTLWLSVGVCSVYLMFWSNTEMKVCPLSFLFVCL